VLSLLRPISVGRPACTPATFGSAAARRA
jgi:hypothetical protein